MTEHEPGRDGRADRKKTRANPSTTGPQPAPDRSGTSPDEQSLFNTDSSARIFGEGSYVEGGSNQEGNFKEREARPHGSRGSFDDAGGYGGKKLLGEKGADEAARRSREASEDETGPSDSIDEN